MKKAFAVAVLLAALSAPAIAADPAWYAYGAVGQTKLDISKGELDDTFRAVTGVTPSTSSLDNKDTGFKVQLGYTFTQNFAVEGGWFDLGKATYRASVSGLLVNADVKASGFGLAGVGIVPIRSNFSLFGKLGMIDAKVEESGSTAGFTVSQSATKWKPMYGIGVTYDINPTAAIRAEYEKFSKLGDKDKTGEGDVTMLSVGMMFRF